MFCGNHRVSVAYLAFWQRVRSDPQGSELQGRQQQSTLLSPAAEREPVQLRAITQIGHRLKGVDCDC